MWTQVSLNCNIVWQDCLWRMVAIWQDDAEEEPIVLERSGRIPLGADTSPRTALIKAAEALAREVAPHPVDGSGL